MGNLQMKTERKYQTQVEEQKRLDQFIHALCVDRSSRQKILSQCAGEYEVGNDYQSIQSLQVSKSDRKYQENEISGINDIISEPYFGRIDLLRQSQSKEELEEVYIGKKGYSDHLKMWVYDWRNDAIARFYYQDDIFEVDSKKGLLSLAFKRRFDIQSNQILKMYDVYEGKHKTEPGITDPYLLTILDKRRDVEGYKDIIATIQQRQNEIIRRPYHDCFIVQGCAGSGKTMLLFHRLSYLKFHHPNWDLSRVKIISPSQNFKIFMNDLSKELELNQIPMMTLNDYYLLIINQYNQKIKAKLADTEITLDDDQVKAIYHRDHVENLWTWVQRHLISTLNHQSTLRGDLNPYEQRRVTREQKRLHDMTNGYLKTKLSALKETIDWLTSEETPLKEPLKIEELAKTILTPFLHHTRRTNFIQLTKDDQPYELFTKALFLYILCGPLDDPDRFLAIDEAQDLSSIDYSILFRVMGQDLVFNLYGDIKQAIHQAGLNTWNQFPFHKEIYELKENYRNPIPIVNYCNTTFNTEMEAIGLDGEDVKKLTFTEFSKLDYLPEKAVIITKNKRTASILQERIKIPHPIIYTIDDVKGLEYNHVYAWLRYLSPKEAYIACTRAMKTLAIIT